MATFSDLGKKISQTGQDVVKKAKDLSEISKYNSYIADEQKKLNSFYMQIGQKYFELFCDTEDENFAGLCASIKESNEKIQEFENEIKIIKNVKICTNCGAECTYDSTFCSSCGANMSDVRTLQNQVTHCKNCGMQIAEDAVFCTGCGQRVER